jgi:hypothetical protein
MGSASAIADSAAPDHHAIADAIASQAKLRHILSQIKDIRDLPVFRPGLPVDTIAIAFPDQLAPTQPQVGKYETDHYKIPFFKRLLKERGRTYSDAQFRALLRKASVSPAYLHAPLAGDPREGVVAFITDRTHGAYSQSEVYSEAFGEEGLNHLLLDDKGRPLNYILVWIREDLTSLSDSEFIAHMVEEEHCYLKRFVRNRDGSTSILNIDFRDLARRVSELDNNPYRGAIGDVQRRFAKILGHSYFDFYQFLDAEALVQNNVVSWDEISKSASAETFEKGIKKVKRFFQSAAALGLPGVPTSCALKLTKARPR